MGKINQRCKYVGVQPKTWLLDNETSKTLEEAFTKAAVQWQYVPPHSHRANLAERAIQTFKNHFKAGLASIDPNFPMDQWDRLLPQAEMTLNMLRSARVNPHLSAYAYMNGEFEFNRTPLAPPGTRVVVHLKKGQKQTWELNGEVAWYIGPSMKHYRCVQCFYPRTNFVRDTNTVKFLPHNLPFPEVTLEDFLRHTASDILDLLKDPPSALLPSLEAGDDTKNAYRRIAEILQRLEPPPPPSATPNTSTSTVPIQDKDNDAAVPRVLVKDDAAVPRVEKHSPSPQQSDKERQRNIDHTINYLKQRFSNSPIDHHTNPTSNMVLPTTPLSFQQRACTFLAEKEIKYSAINHIYDDDGKRQTVERLMRGEDKHIWVPAMSNELGRLSQGNNKGVQSTDCMVFIHHDQVLPGKKVTYANFVCDHRPLKSEPYRIRLVVGGDKLEYEFDVGAPAASMLETKVLINSVISNAKQGARFMSADLKDFFLSSQMKDPEFMKIPWKLIPEDIRSRYNLQDKLHNGFVYVRINRGMYGLKQAAVLAYEQLVTHLQAYSASHYKV